MPMGYEIIRNSAKCANCFGEIESKHVHDYITCECGMIAVDGGHYYLKSSAGDLKFFINTSIVRAWEPEEFSARRVAMIAEGIFTEDMIDRMLEDAKEEADLFRMGNDYG
jgi:hypothetical protein